MWHHKNGWKGSFRYAGRWMLNQRIIGIPFLASNIEILRSLNVYLNNPSFNVFHCWLCICDEVCISNAEDEMGHLRYFPLSKHFELPIYWAILYLEYTCWYTLWSISSGYSSPRSNGSFGLALSEYGGRSFNPSPLWGRMRIDFHPWTWITLSWELYKISSTEIR